MTDDIVNNVYFCLSMTGLVLGITHYGIKQCCHSSCSKLKLCGITVLEREIDPNIPVIRTFSDSV